MGVCVLFISTCTVPIRLPQHDKPCRERVAPLKLPANTRHARTRRHMWWRPAQHPFHDDTFGKSQRACKEVHLRLTLPSVIESARVNNAGKIVCHLGLCCKCNCGGITRGRGYSMPMPLPFRVEQLAPFGCVSLWCDASLLFIRGCVFDNSGQNIYYDPSCLDISSMH